MFNAILEYVGRWMLVMAWSREFETLSLEARRLLELWTLSGNPKPQTLYPNL